MAIRKNDNELKYEYRAKKVKGKRIDMQRYVMEQVLGRPLDKNEIVHHIDGNKLNNDPSNLQIMTKAEHVKLHRIEGKLHTVSEKELIDAWKRGAFDKLKKPVCAFNPVTNELVKEYTSVTCVEQDGFTRWRVSKCCAGKFKTYKNLIWRFKNEVINEGVC